MQRYYQAKQRERAHSFYFTHNCCEDVKTLVTAAFQYPFKSFMLECISFEMTSFIYCVNCIKFKMFPRKVQKKSEHWVRNNVLNSSINCSFGSPKRKPEPNIIYSGYTSVSSKLTYRGLLRIVTYRFPPAVTLNHWSSVTAGGNLTQTSIILNITLSVSHSLSS